MQVTKGTWRRREQCVPGSLSSSPAQEPGNEARCMHEGRSTLALELAVNDGFRGRQLPSISELISDCVSVCMGYGGSACSMIHLALELVVNDGFRGRAAA